MPQKLSSTRRRLIQAALELFTSQGVTETTTRQIAELAQVNEVTLFRQFGNKQGLLLAVIEDSAVFTHLGEALKDLFKEDYSFKDAIKTYARDRLQSLEEIPALLRSFVGEAGKFTVENRRALGEGITAANRAVAKYLELIVQRDEQHLHIPPEKFASLLNGLLFGYLVIELTSEFHELWIDREDFLIYLVELCLHGAISLETFNPKETESVADLPATVVHQILQKAKKLSFRHYALAYALFATGLRPQEVVELKRSHRINNSEEHLLQIPSGAVRQVPVNQWIMGKRYGSYTSNPLSQWLKNRQDSQSALFLNAQGTSLSEAQLHSTWEEFTAGISTPTEILFTEQARHTWCVEMLSKGMTVEDLSLLSGSTIPQLKPFVRRAKEKAALAKAMSLDQKTNAMTPSINGINS